MNFDDLRRLSLKDVGNWPLVPKLLILGGVFLAIVALGALFDWKEQWDTLDRSQKEEGTLRDQYSQKKAKAINFDAYRAIVVLGGGSYFAAPEYGGDTVSSGSLVRIRYAARLQRETGLPLLVSGGAPLGGVPEGRSMQAALEKEFGVKVRWVEDASADTRDNARNSAPLLREAGVKRVLLVTHAWHMRRAQEAFAIEQLEVVAAPTGYEAQGPLTALEFLPGPGGLWAGRIALNEWLGRLVQKLS